MKELWRRGRDLDVPLEPDVKASWSTWFNQFADLTSIVIPRHVWAEVGEENIELHLFTDASQRAMAAVAYLKCQQNDEVKIFLLMSKTHVAPLKKMSIPKLELQACLLVVRLAECVKKKMELKRIKVIF